MEVAWEITGLAILAGVLVVAAVFILLHHRMTPERRERLRRLTLNKRGRLVDGVITEVGDNALYYSYSIGGVAYNTSQDVAQLEDLLPTPRERMIGPVWLKYSAQNPANSIVICEQWSGLRRLPERKETPQAPQPVAAPTPSAEPSAE